MTNSKNGNEMTFSNKICFLCLEGINNVFEIFGKEGIDLNVGVILQQHFWFEVDTFAAKSICEVCWIKVESFHNFYNVVKSIHQRQTVRRSEQSCETKATIDNGLVHSIKEEPIDIKDFVDDLIDISDTIDSPASSNELKEDRTEKWIYNFSTSKLSPYRYKTDTTLLSPATQTNVFEVDSDTTKSPAPRTWKSNSIRLTSADTTDDFPTPSNQLEVDKTSAKEPVPVANRAPKSKPRKSASPDTAASRAKLKDLQVDADTAKNPATVAPKKRKYVRKTSKSPPPYKYKSDVHTPLLSQYFNMACDICDTLLTSFRHTKKHYREVHDVKEGYLICCNKKYDKLPHMLSHCEWHTNPDAFKCSQCSKAFRDRASLQLHFNKVHISETEKIFKCKDCDKKFARLAFLTAHQRISHDPILKCPVCQKCFTDKVTLRHHIRDVHSEEEEREFRIKLKSLKKVDPVKKKDYQFECEICSRRYFNLAQLRNHIKRVHCNVGRNGRNADSHSHICEICGKPFRTVHGYNNHYSNVHTNTPKKVLEKVQCDICGRWLKYKSKLRAHMLRHKGKPVTCKLCGRVSSCLANSLAHIRRVHREAWLECNICGKMFKSRVCLKEHMAIHYGITDLYSCNFCTKTFRSSANMCTHRKRAHPAELEQLRNCKTNV